MGDRTRRNPAEKWAWIEAAATITDDVCCDWPWRTANGYGAMTIAGRPQRVHAIVCALVHGERPEGMVACHSCHRPVCASGAHLRWDTREANQADRIAAGTHQFGERNTRAKLSESDVRAIRARYAAGGISQSALGAQYGVSQASVSYIVRGINWSRL